MNRQDLIKKLESINEANFKTPNWQELEMKMQRFKDNPLTPQDVSNIFVQGYMAAIDEVLHALKQ